MKRLPVIAAVAAAGLLALTACSSDSDSDAATTTPASTPTTAAEATIVELASTTDDLSTLVSAVQAADLVSTLEGPGPFTVFAPTNEAFAALPTEVTERLLLPCNKQALTKILTYHVVAGEVPSTAIEPGDVATVEGQDVTLAVTDGTVTVNDATVVTADVEASNGVVHVIDGVLVPSDVDPAALKASC